MFDNTKNPYKLEGLENTMNPEMILAFLKGVKRFSKGEISYKIERGEVVPALTR